MLIKGIIFVIGGAMPILAWNWFYARRKSQPEFMTWLGLLVLIPWLLLIAGCFYLGIAIADIFFSDGGSPPALAPGILGLGFAATLPRFVNMLSGYIERQQEDSRKLTDRFTAASRGVSAYSMDKNQQTVEEGQINKRGALRIARQRLENYKEFYEDSDQSLVDGHFGFMRSNKNFLEIGIIGKEWGSYLWYEGEEDKRVLFWKVPGFSRYQLSKAPGDKVSECIEKYFDLSAEEFLLFFKKSGAKIDRGNRFGA